jgi:hypothetical protein
MDNKIPVGFALALFALVVLFALNGVHQSRRDASMGTEHHRFELEPVSVIDMDLSFGG